jgi:hypothetical protein
MPSLKAQELLESNAVTATISRGNGMTNSIHPLFRQAGYHRYRASLGVDQLIRIISVRLAPLPHVFRHSAPTVLPKKTQHSYQILRRCAGWPRTSVMAQCAGGQHPLFVTFSTMASVQNQRSFNTLTVCSRGKQDAQHVALP